MADLPPEPLSSYTTWLTRLLKYFFGPHSAGQRVRLLVTRDVLDTEFPDLGGTVGFLQATRSGPEWIDGKQTLRERGLWLHRQRLNPIYRPANYPKELVNNLFNAPPFLPYLCLLCLAWTEDHENMAAHAFYPRLTKLYPDHDLSHALSEWESLWEGLKRWTESLDNRWGYFEIDRLGGMPHVGIPKAQVVLTPEKIERLPELFVFCNLRPHSVPQTNILRDLIVNRSESATLLGPNLFKEIQSDTELGQTALKLILEQLSRWDGELPCSPSRSTRQQGQRGAELSLLLEPADQNTRWIVRFGIEDGENWHGLRFPTRNWTVKCEQHSLALITEGQRLVDGVLDFPNWSNGFVLNGEWRENRDGEDQARFSFPQKAIRLFSRWIGPRLLEVDRLSADNVFVLLSKKGKGTWDAWFCSRAHLLQCKDFTFRGLPEGWQLLHLTNLGALDEESRKSFPGNTHHRTEAAILRFVAGTRVSSNVARRAYADYDPPEVLIEAPPDAELSVSGADAEELPRELPPPGFPGSVARAFALKVQSSASVVIAKVRYCGGSEVFRDFGVWRDPKIRHTHESSLDKFVDEFGEFPRESGMLGIKAPAASQPWHFVEETADPREAYTRDLVIDFRSKFIESLFLKGGKLTYQEVRRRALTITGLPAWRIGQEIRWLADLAFIEIEADSKGRWAYIHPNPLQLCLLPSTTEGMHQCVILGCGPAANLIDIIEYSKDLECTVKVTDSGGSLLPPRTLLIHKELDAFEMLASDKGLRWEESPPSHLVSLFSASLEDWLQRQDLHWFEGEGPTPVAEYIPYTFEVAERRFSSPYRLCFIPDPHTQRHRWHLLVRNNMAGEARHTFVRDRA